MIVDTHAHLTDEKLDGNLSAYLCEASEAGVGEILTVGITVDSSRRCVEIATEHAQVRAAVGIHPNNCCQASPSDWDAIEQLATHGRVAAIGETGLDKYWDDCPWDIQCEYFRKHLSLSRETGLPVVIHTRECADEMLEILQKESDLGQLSGVMHSFTGPLSVATGCLEIGLYISFAGMVTYKNADEIRLIAAQIPEDRYLVETDSPYLTPHPCRGQRPNHPALVTHTLKAVADARGIPVEQAAEESTRNAHRLFGAW